MAPRRVKLLALSSGGGHWVQLLRLRPAFVGCDVTFATVKPAYRTDVSDGDANFRIIPDFNRWQRFRAFWSLLHIALLLVRIRPDVIVSTGAAPGFVAIRLGRLLGARTVWVDSIANAEELSLSGQKAGRVAHLWLTQWEHLARPGGPHFRGNVL